MRDADINVFPMQDGTPQAEGHHSYCLPKDSLSSRETEICRLLVKGMSLKEVAHQLSISIHTANCHTRHAYLKLGVHNRAKLVTYFEAPNIGAEQDNLPDTGPMLAKA
jgi:DNA-binding CsgD family transcriptional regulator